MLIKYRQHTIITLAVFGILFFAGSMLMLFHWASSSSPSLFPVEYAAAKEMDVQYAGVEDSLELIVLATPVFVQYPNSNQPVQISGSIKVPTTSTVSTGETGRAEIRYPNKSITRLNTNTTVVIKTFEKSPQKSILRVIKGTIWNRISKLLGNEGFTTETGSMVATVRGTAYEVEVLPDGTDNLKVVEGKVAVNADNKSFLLEKNEQIIANTKNAEPVRVEDYIPDFSTEWNQLNLEKDMQWMVNHSEEYREYFQAITPTTANDSLNSFPVIFSPTPLLEPCIGPDDIHFSATKKDCESLNNFWNSVNPK